MEEIWLHIITVPIHFSGDICRSGGGAKTAFLQGLLRVA
jgi:hypothetical protein